MLDIVAITAGSIYQNIINIVKNEKIFISISPIFWAQKYIDIGKGDTDPALVAMKASSVEFKQEAGAHKKQLDVIRLPLLPSYRN